jgi:hypothetical protein
MGGGAMGGGVGGLVGAGGGFELDVGAIRLVVRGHTGVLHEIRLYPLVNIKSMTVLNSLYNIKQKRPVSRNTPCSCVTLLISNLPTRGHCCRKTGRQ